MEKVDHTTPLLVCNENHCESVESYVMFLVVMRKEPQQKPLKEGRAWVGSQFQGRQRSRSVRQLVPRPWQAGCGERGILVLGNFYLFMKFRTLARLWLGAADCSDGSFHISSS